jgi:ATP-dependent Clp protease ATP-binding subunit ClpX
LPTRARQLSLFARPRANRFDIGFSVNIKPEAHAELNEQEIDQLKKEDIVKILTKPKNAIITQYKKLLYFNDVDLRFTPSALDEIAKVTLSLGTGARGIRGILETILEDVMFDLNDKEPVVINKKYVERKLKKYNSTEIKNNNASNSKTKLAV